MDHDNTGMTSETQEKENSSANGDHSNRLCSEEDYTNPADNDPARILQLSQPFFVADTVEDDESLIIPPTQDSEPFMIPSTPVCTNKTDRSSEVDPNASTVSMLEETCIDLESKSEHSDLLKDANQISNASNETDLTQDLDMEPTQPIIPSNPAIDDFSKMSNDTEKKNSNVDDDDDDDWQLKFSETQTQDLLNFEKNSKDQKEIQPELPDTSILSKEPDKKDDDDDDDDLPETQGIEIPQRFVEDDCDNNINMPKLNENIDIVEIPSDDEIEPSQSCLSEYKGETISTSFKVQSSVDEKNNDTCVKEILKPDSETGYDAKENVKGSGDIEIISEGETRTINISESEPKDMLNMESKGKIEDMSLSVEEISIDERKEDKKVKQEENLVNDIEENEIKELNTSETMEIEIVEDIKEKSISSQNSLKLSFKTCIREVEITDANGESDVAKLSKDEGIEEIKLIEDRSKKITEIKEKEPEQNSNEESELVRCNKPIGKEIKDSENITELKDRSIGVTEIETADKIGVKESTPGDKSSTKLDMNEINKNKITEAQILNEEVEVAKEDANKSLETADAEHLQHPSQDFSVTSQTDKPAKNTELPPVIDSQPNKMPSEVKQVTPKQIAEEKTETPITSFIPPLPSRSYGSMRKKLQNKVAYHEASVIDRSDKKVCIGSYKDIKSLEKLLKSFGISLDKEKMETVLSKQTEELEIKTVFSLTNQKLFLKEYSIESEHHRQDSGISPVSSSSTNTSSNLSLKSSIHSGEGEMADISSSLSGKSNSCGIQMDATTQSINILSSQDTESVPKTSTQKYEPVVFSEVFGKKSPVESKSKSDVSAIDPPIKSGKTTKTTASKRKRGGKKNAESSSNETSGSNDLKRKRARTTKAKGSVEDMSEETEDSKDVVVEVKPRKATRRKKGATVVPDKIPEDIKPPVEDIEMLIEDDASVQEEANFGSILPGVKVMARWKDGYYYSGMVQSQELDGKWAVQFEDGFVHTIAPENLIKIAILPKGTSVLVQSPDDYYDPGIVCGHFREGNKVGYEVELDNGVTRRYSRSSVILSGDQAKVIMSNRPPTTPATMTINLDNIIDGKRKRKSVQSPVSSPVAKKSPRITRSKKPDSNLDTTAESSTVETISVKSKESKDSENEEPVPKKSKTRKGAKKNAATSKNNKPTSTDSSDNTKSSVAESTNNTKAMKVLPQRSAKKLFKDYAFLLTNADRKVAVKPPDSSDLESIREEEDIVPFNKDELCEHITSGGGIILEKFDDVKKCTRKHIYLLANSYLRTMKYIQCIAAGISCIKHHWVQNCLFKTEILSVNSYILPSGFSLVSQKVIEWHGKTDVFKGCKIALVSAPESPFVYTWAPVLLAAKADFVQKWSLPSSVSGCSLVVDVLITNHHCPPDIIQSAKKRKIPIVSSEWIIQCLIMGKPLPYDAHPKFKYDYTEK